MHLGHRHPRGGSEDDPEYARDHVEGLAQDRQCGRISLDELDRSLARPFTLGERHHLGRKIDTGDLGGAEPRRLKRQRTGAARHVEHPVARTDPERVTERARGGAEAGSQVREIVPRHLGPGDGSGGWRRCGQGHIKQGAKC